jgi:hypothetical protein
MVGYTTIRDHRVFCSRRVVTTRDMGMNSKVGGTRYTRKIPMLARSPHRPNNRARLYAAGTVRSRVMVTTPSPTRAVFSTHRANHVLVKA